MKNETGLYCGSPRAEGRETGELEIVPLVSLVSLKIPGVIKLGGCEAGLSANKNAFSERVNHVQALKFPYA